MYLDLKLLLSERLEPDPLIVCPESGSDFSYLGPGIRVESKMHFSVFAKMRKSCENEKKLFSQKFWAKRKEPIFAKIFAKILYIFPKKCNFLQITQNFCIFAKIFVIFVYFRLSLNIFAKMKTKIFAKMRKLIFLFQPYLVV
jgi:hypothetical protein